MHSEGMYNLQIECSGRANLIGRRQTLAGLGAFAAASLLPAPAVWAGDGVRRFRVLLGGTKVGEQRISAELTQSGLVAIIETDLVLRVLGIPVWRYTQQAREVWHGGKLMSLRSRTNENGKNKFANAKRVNGGLEVKGSKFEGFVKGSPATSTYWNKAFMNRPVWINAQNGKPYEVTAKHQGKVLFPTPLGKIESDVWKTDGKLKLKVYFDQSDECVGSRFDVKGRQASMMVTQMGGDFSRLWDQS